MLLLRIGTSSSKKDKLYDKLPELIENLKDIGCEFVKINELLDQEH